MKKALVIFLACIFLNYAYTAKAENNDNDMDREDETIRFKVPVGLEVKPKIMGATLKWHSVKRAIGYRIYWEKNNSVTSTSPCLNSVDSSHAKYDVQDLTPGVLYKFAVTAIYRFGESQLSKQVGVIPIDEIKRTLRDEAP